jgi:ankyrin repeat protein
VLQAAAVGGNFELLTLLLQNGADPNVPGGYLKQLCTRKIMVANSGGHYGTVLQAAAVGGNLEAVQLLLGKGVDPNIPGESSTEPYTRGLKNNEF